MQDTDLSYRPRVTYTRWREEGSGWWQVKGGNRVTRGYVRLDVKRED